MKTICSIILLFSFWIINAQQSFLKGKVESNGTPVLANISIKGINKTVGTDLDGNYSLQTTLGTHVITIAAIGYKAQEVELTFTENKIQTKNFNLKEDILGLEKVVVTATRGYLNRKKTPVIVTVTDAKILEATQAVSLSEGLNFQPGLRMETNCQNCGTSEVKMNGLGGSYSQILIDSRPIFSALNSVYGLDQIPANIIKQIEVVRGGGSALYGSNAIAGTINIITKDPSENSFTIGSNLALIDGTTQDKTITFNGTIINEDFDTGIALFGMKRNRGSYDADNDGFTEITELENTSFGLKAFTRPTDRKKITAEFNANNEYRRGGNNLNVLPFLADVTEQIESTVVSGGLTYEYLSPTLKDNYSVYASTSVSNNNNFYGGLAGNTATDENIKESIEGFGNSKDITFVTGTQYAHKFDQFLNNTGTFTGGVEYKYNDIDDRKENPDFEPILQTTHILGIYGQQEWVVNNRLRFLGGLRGDIHNLADEFVVLNPRVNILYSIHKNLRWRTSYAKGFRAPQIYGEDVHAGLAAGEISRIRNADGLKSETSHSFLTSLDWTKELAHGDFSLVTEIFHTQLNNAFALEQGTEIAPNSGIFEWIRSNSSGAKVYGVNIEVKYAPNIQWLFQAGATIQRSLYNDKVEWSEDELDQATREFNKTPNVYANFVATYAPTKTFQNNLSGVFTGPMHVQHLAGFIPNDKLEKSPSFFELNWKSSYQFYLDNHKHTYFEVSGGIQNIFHAYQSDFDQGADRDVTYIYGPQRPRTFFLGLKFGI
ncbi:outer membrane receptor for ferrienterochelin and colicins [Wenyingzhuangia heitensis]|uniref:Outer membrane receptor for ferrienterochelin and colicins n=1 Tax=Wenyingzhuangia heitensis TaxID=1487859 RepID=A0ABX0U7Y1_9FLAO|nr:TonB-dependent receptor [Wenyingzhuangia heitensis]NIJ43731.1 outer membrane receptor for ferrienterochelin and colicins [Wenyingzhuangia heitensis]